VFLRKDVILKTFGDGEMQGCDSEGVTEGSRRNAIRMDSAFTEHDNPKGTGCQGVFTLQVIRIGKAEHPRLRFEGVASVGERFENKPGSLYYARRHIRSKRT